MNPEAIIIEMQQERRSQDVATYGWMPHPEDIEALGKACAERDLRHIAAGLDQQDGVEVSVDEPDWDALERACGADIIENEPHIREVFGQAYRQAVEESENEES